MTTLVKQLLADGWNVLVSPVVTPDQPFVHSDGVEKTIAFHPLNYSYASLEDPFEAHAKNMALIEAEIDEKFNQLEDKLDDMYWESYYRHNPRIITFMHNVGVTEMEDGSFSFHAQAYDADGPNRPMIFESTMGSSPFMRQKIKEARDLIGASEEERTDYGSYYGYPEFKEN